MSRKRDTGSVRKMKRPFRMLNHQIFGYSIFFLVGCNGQVVIIDAFKANGYRLDARR